VSLTSLRSQRRRDFDTRCASGLLRALPGNGRNLTPSSPRYFSSPVEDEKSRPDFAGPHDLGRRVKRCSWRSLPGAASGTHRPAETPAFSAQRGSSVASCRPHAPPDIGRTLCTRRTSSLRARALGLNRRPRRCRATASRLASVTIAIRPSSETGWIGI